MSNRSKNKSLENRRSGSCWRPEFYIKKGYSKEEAIEIVKSVQRKNSNKVNNRHKIESSPRRIEYWLNRGFTESEAKQKVSEFQRSCSPRCVEYWIKHKGYSIDNAKKEISKLQTKNSGNSIIGFSKISQELFNQLPKCNDTFFASLDNGFIDSINKEYILECKDGSYIRPDYVNIKTMKIIEFDGDYFHSDKKTTPEKEQQRDNKIAELGYNILHIKEHEYKQNKDFIINKCKEFLQQGTNQYGTKT